MEGILSIGSITSVIVIVFTLLFQYLPGLRVKWAALASNAKRGIVLGLYLVAGAIAGFGGCWPALAGIFPALLCVTGPTFLEFAFGVLVAIGAGQGVFKLLPELGDVTEAKAAR